MGGLTSYHFKMVFKIVPKLFILFNDKVVVKLSETKCQKCHPNPIYLLQSASTAIRRVFSAAGATKGHQLQSQEGGLCVPAAA